MCCICTTCVLFALAEVPSDVAQGINLGIKQNVGFFYFYGFLQAFIANSYEAPWVKIALKRFKKVFTLFTLLGVQCTSVYHKSALLFEEI